MTERGVNLAEPDDIETLNLATTFQHSWTSMEYVRIGVLAADAAGANGTISFQLVQFSKPDAPLRDQCKALQANLTRAEIDIVIDGLEKARERMENSVAV